MTQQQQTYYQQIIQFLSLQNTHYSFCLDSQFYATVFASGNMPNGNDRKVIGREFSKQVKNGGNLSINQFSVTVSFNYIFSSCSRCGYKDAANKNHYILI